MADTDIPDPNPEPVQPEPAPAPEPPPAEPPLVFEPATEFKDRDPGSTTDFHIEKRG